MRSGKLGGSASGVEVANISKHGFWLLVGDKGRFLPFEDLPWFREATVGQLFSVTLPQPHHLYWPDLDIDLAVDSIDYPERYPLVSREGLNQRLQRTAKRGR